MMNKPGSNGRRSGKPDRTAKGQAQDDFGFVILDFGMLQLKADPIGS